MQRSRTPSFLDTPDLRRRHNRALALLATGNSVDGLAEIDAAILGGLSLPETLTARAHLLADLGRNNEAVDQYRMVIAAYPTFIQAQQALARLLPQLGRGAEALDGFRSALARFPYSAPLWLAALIAATELDDSAQLAEWGERGARILGDYPEFAIARATAAARRGRPEAAVATLRELLPRTPEPQPVHLHLAHALTSIGDFWAAEKHATSAAALAPEDQAPWALLTLLWRLQGDAREQWLADYDRLVMPVDLPLSAQDLDRLNATLARLHVAREHPAEQSLRGGTQTRGALFDRHEPELRDLAGTIRAAVRERLARLRPDPTHPFLRRLAPDIVYSGSWSVRLRSAGRHVPHIHQQGWLSSALYIEVPPEIAVDAGAQGALTFGQPDERLGLALPPRRIETPRPGRLVIFPSFFWHGTLPFESRSPRLTVAFDAVPA